MLDSIVDGTTFSIDREEDSNYQLVIKTLGDAADNNSDAAEATTVPFSSFSAAYATIPAGTDLYQYFQENPIPDSSDNVNYDLEAGSEYTISQVVSFGSHQVTLRCTNKQNRPIITPAADAGIRAGNALTLKNLKFNYVNTTEAFVTLDSEPSEDIPTSNGFYIIDNPIAFSGCDIDNLSGNLIYDNNKKYAVKTFLMNDCYIHFTFVKNVEGQAMVYFKSGFVKDLTFKNNSMWNTGSCNTKFAIQYANNQRSSRVGISDWADQGLTLTNNTMYNIASGKFANYSGFSGQETSYFTVTDNIFVECALGGGGVAKQILCGRNVGSYKAGSCVFNNNTYWTKVTDGDGNVTYQSETGYEDYDTGNVFTTDPALKDPTNGDLTPTGAEQVAAKTGDSRWY